MSSNDKLARSLPHLQNLIKRDPDAYREDVKENTLFRIVFII